jgi:hypothetical protein
MYNPKSEFLICGDINTDYHSENNQKKQMKSLLTMHNLTHTINCATRIQNDSRTATDNMFVDSTRFSSSSTSSIINGLSDHDDQHLVINNTAEADNLISLKQRTRKINTETIMQFQLLLKNETWEIVYKDSDTNNEFNVFCLLF